MKKEYINPELEAIDLKINQQLLAESLGKEEGNIDPNDVGAPEFEFDD